MREVKKKRENNVYIVVVSAVRMQYSEGNEPHQYIVNAWLEDKITERSSTNE